MKGIRTQATVKSRERTRGTALADARNPIWERWIDMAAHMNPVRYQQSLKARALENLSFGKERTTYAYFAPPVPWLPLLERRIQNSIVPEEYQEDRQAACRSGEWLHEDVAISALDFFSKAGDLLPSEPYIYSSKSGNLVAEFAMGSLPMTTVISPESVTIMMVENDAPSETTIKRLSNSLRETLKELKARVSP